MAKGSQAPDPETEAAQKAKSDPVAVQRQRARRLIIAAGAGEL